MKVLSIVIAHLQQDSIAIFPCLYYWFLKVHSFPEVQSTTNKALKLFQSLGLLINLEKSTQMPHQTIDLVGATLDD